MVSKKPNAEDTVSDKKSNIRISSILEKFGGNFSQIDIFGGQKRNFFHECGQNSRNFLPV